MRVRFTFSQFLSFVVRCLRVTDELMDKLLEEVGEECERVFEDCTNAFVDEV